MKKSLGFRADSKAPRYAIVSKRDDDEFELENFDGENRLLYPADRKSVEQRLAWLAQELERIFRDHPDIQTVIIKTSEYELTEKAAMREASYAEAVLLLMCSQKQIPVEARIYRSLGTKSGTVKSDAEDIVGRTNMRWDNKMADAVMAAAKGLED